MFCKYWDIVIVTENLLIADRLVKSIEHERLQVLTRESAAFEILEGSSPISLEVNDVFIINKENRCLLKDSLATPDLKDLVFKIKSVLKKEFDSEFMKNF